MTMPNSFDSQITLFFAHFLIRRAIAGRIEVQALDDYVCAGL